MDLSKFGYLRISARSPRLFLAKPGLNAKEIIKESIIEEKKGSQVVLFPELSLTGYTCEDLFHSSELLEETEAALTEIVNKSKKINSLIVFGLPFQLDEGKLLNCACIVFKGKILAMIPKNHRPNYGEFYEKRWFSSGYDVHQEVNINNQKVLVSAHQIVKFKKALIGVEICEDLWSPSPPSVNLALNGANIILNLSASNELIGKSSYRLELVKQQSARLNCAYIYASAGSFESTKDVVFGGHCLIAENGTLLAEIKELNFDSKGVITDIDLEKISLERRRNSTFSMTPTFNKVIVKEIDFNYKIKSLIRKYSNSPFIPQKQEDLNQRTQEILNIQAMGLARRLLSLPKNSRKIVLGLSGGLDSTLALLVTIEACRKINQDIKEIKTISMPGFGTSERTRKQAQDLAKAAGVSFEEISIVENVREHLKSIKHQENDHSVVFENAQARERTMILFNLANKFGGLVLGTGDLSELALGWCTYNGDQNSNYNVNASIPKTLVKFLVKNYAQNTNKEFKETLEKIVNTEISPELLPTKKGKISQKTEDILGPYEVHDFILFHYLRNGFNEKKIEFLLNETFSKKYSNKELSSWLKLFFKRFKTQQFKRTTLPPGPKVGSVSLSPRGDWRMPDETGEDNE